MTVILQRKLAFGNQNSTIGTPGAPAVLISGLQEDGALDSLVVHEKVRSLRGTLAPGRDTTFAIKGGTFAGTFDLTYEQLPYLLDGTFDSETPTGSGPYTWTWNGHTTAAVTPRYQTIYFGDVTRYFGLIGALVTELTFESDSQSRETASVTFTGADAVPVADYNVTQGAETIAVSFASGDLYTANGSARPSVGQIYILSSGSVDFTGGEMATAKGSAVATGDMFRITNATISSEAVEYLTNVVNDVMIESTIEGLTETASLTNIMGGHAAVYIDDVTGTMGATAYECAQSYSLAIDFTRNMQYCLDGSKAPGDFYDTAPDFTLELSLKLSNVSEGMAAQAFVKETKKYIRIESDIGATGTGQRVFRRDMVGVITEPPTIYTDNDGLTTVDLSFMGIEDSSEAWLELVVIDNLASLY
jgi:hypothetical protein